MNAAGLASISTEQNYEQNLSGAGLTNQEVVQLQTRIMDQQDSQLDQLHETVTRQKLIGLEIGNELDMHVDLLQQTDQLVDNTQQRLTSADRRLGIR
eukprot:jgi/Hompol1/275/HPOL_002468-RA